MIDIKSVKTRVLYTFLTLLYLSSFLLSIIGYTMEMTLTHIIFKSLVVPSIMAYTYLSWEGPRNKEYTLLQLAFLFALIGDIILALPRTHPGLLFLGGLSFFFQHVLYIWLNLAIRNVKSSLWKTPYLGLPTIGYVILFSISYWAHGDVVDKIQYAIYSFILGTSFYTCFYRETKTKVSYILGIIGFTLFVISDVILLLDALVVPMTRLQASTRFVTYYISQSLICQSHILESKAMNSQTVT